MKRSSYSKPLLSHFSISLHTLERTVLIEREALSHLLNPKWQMAGERKGSFFLGYFREQIQWRRGGACSSED